MEGPGFYTARRGACSLGVCSILEARPAFVDVGPRASSEPSLKPRKEPQSTAGLPRPLTLLSYAARSPKAPAKKAFKRKNSWSERAKTVVRDTRTGNNPQQLHANPSMRSYAIVAMAATAAASAERARRPPAMQGFFDEAQASAQGRSSVREEDRRRRSPGAGPSVDNGAQGRRGADCSNCENGQCGCENRVDGRPAPLHILISRRRATPPAARRRMGVDVDEANIVA